MSETIVLDASAIATNRTQLDITSYVDVDGIDWGDSQIQEYLADQTFGSTPVDYRIPNRTIKIPLNLRVVGATSFATVRTNLQQKVGLLQREGGWLMRTVGATNFYADIVNATLHLGGSWLQAFADIDIEATLELECLPDWYGDEVTLSDHVETTAAELIFTEATVNGSYPSRVRLVVDNDQATDQHGAFWGFRCRNYGTATTEALAYEAEALTRLDAGTLVAHSGASGGTVLQHPSLPAGAWCPVMATNIGGSAFMTHRGSYRVWGRCYSGTATPQLRFLWDVGDMSSPVTNDIVQIPGAANFYLIDFGEVRLDPAPVGPHRWEGVIQANAAQQGDQVEIDRLWFQPLDESAGKLAAVQTAASIFGLKVSSSPAAAVGTITGSTTGLIQNPTNVFAADGSYCSMICGGGGAPINDPTGFLNASTYGFAVPTGATIAGIQVDVLRFCPVYGSYNMVDVVVQLMKAGTRVGSNLADTITPIPLSLTNKTYGGASNLWGTTWAASDVNNTGFGVSLEYGAPIGTPSAFHQRTTQVDYIKVTIFYTTSGGFSTVADSVIYASRTAELRTEGMFRQDSGGTAYGPVSQVIGDLPRLPPSGLEARTVQALVKLSRGNLSTEADAGIDDLSARITYRPSHLFIG